MPYVVGGQFEQLPEWYRDILRSFMEQTESLRKQKYPGYGAPRVAAVPEDILKSHEIARENIGKHLPYYQQARELLNSSNLPYGQQLKQYMDPYMENVVNNIAKKGKRLLSEQIMPQLEAKFVGLGQHGSSRHKDLSLRAARDLEEAILERQQEAMSRGFENSANIHAQENLRKMEAARNLTNLGLGHQASTQQDVNLINSLGVQQQAHRQQELNEKQAEYWREQMWPHQSLSQQSGLLHGMAVPASGKTTMEYVPPSPIPQVNTLGQVGSMAAQLYGLGKQPGVFKRGGRVIPLTAMKFRKASSKNKRRISR